MFIGVDVIAYGCIIRRTHNLPYAQQNCNVQKRWPSNFFLECIDPYWRKLDFLIAIVPIIEGINYHKDVAVFISSFLKCNNKIRNWMLNKLREIPNVVSVPLVHPVEKLPTRGRMKRKVSSSKRRNPCAFELVTYEVDSSCLPSKSSRVTKKIRWWKLSRGSHQKKRFII